MRMCVSVSCVSCVECGVCNKHFIGNLPFTTTEGTSGIQQYVNVINYLKEQICVRNKKTMFFRTWDLYPDRMVLHTTHYTLHYTHCSTHCTTHSILFVI